MSTDRVRRRLIVSGLVQGVWFRESCREQAVSHGVSGSVRNLSDGRVEVVLEGAPDAVNRMVAWCREGPPRAHVSDVEVTDEPAQGDTAFRVR